MKEFKDGVRFRRVRKSLSANRENIVERVLRFFEMDEAARDVQRNLRLQRYAKYRMVTNGKTWPWQDASDVSMPDMMIQSLRIQDTLHNAVMSSESPVTARPLDERGKERAENVDKLITHQLFVDQNGEAILGEFIESFVNDSVGTILTHWVREVIDSTRTKSFPAPQDSHVQYFKAILAQEFPNVTPIPNNEGWDWRVGDKTVSFYTLEDDRIEMVVKTKVEVFNGPKPIVYGWENVLHPPRAANLQPPAPSNPRGAGHVILKEFPSVATIDSLIKKGFFDLAPKDINIGDFTRAGDKEEGEQQKDDLAGHTETISGQPPDSHKTLTLLMCFDGYDIDDDGLDEQIVWWVLKEPKILLKAALVSEIWPFSRPKRPFAEATFLPVEGRRQGISLLEMVEGFYDTKKVLLDQAIDAGAITNLPFFFYRAAGGTRPEVIQLAPGEGYPLADPRNDVNFPNIQNNTATNNINLMTILTGAEEKLTMAGDIQFGRVPPGAASALRTVGGIALLQNQGEARPERILRRLFMGIRELYSQIHELNKVYLPKGKRILVSNPKRKDDDPYEVVESIDRISGEYEFAFSANVFNTSRIALQQALGTLIQTYVNPVAIQLGIASPESIYRLFRDFGKAQGQDPDQYLEMPSNDALKPRIFAQEAIQSILAGRMPDAVPIEGAEEHLQKLVEFSQTDDFGLFNEHQVKMFGDYIARVRDFAIQQQQRAQLAQAAQALQQQGQAGRPPENAPQIPPGTAQPNQPIDRSLNA